MRKNAMGIFSLTPSYRILQQNYLRCQQIKS